MRITPEKIYWRRREVLRAMGFLGMSALLGGCGEAPRGGRWPVDRPLTPEDVAARFNNFYEFSEDKGRVHELVGRFQVRPWTLKVDGLVEKPRTFDLDEVLKLPHEERIYRFRCVEAWAMTVPWTGVPLARLLAECRPLSSAKFVRFTSFLKPDEAPNQGKGSKYPWPYYEALSIEEAMHELTLVASGIYGHPLPKQHGAPLRIVVPWKYGYKSPKSIVRIELVAEKPHTFWNDLEPAEYSFWSNVEPHVPHPRWSQATERLIGTGERVPTLLYNGYGEQVAKLYKS
jgi:sulfoxide reductase catalytic subunit YedY